MSLFPRTGLLVSLPAAELAGAELPGSLFEARELRAAKLSSALLCALRLVRQHCAAHRIPLRLIARPEIYPHGEPLAWLRRHLGRIRDHLILCDGSTVRPLLGLRNHLFCYQPGVLSAAQAFERFSAAAPELLAGLHSQINSCYRFVVDARSVTPKPLVLMPAKGATSAARYWTYFPRASMQQTLKHTLASAAISTQRLKQRLPSPGVLLALPDETVLSDATACNVWSRRLAQARAGGGCLVIALPAGSAATQEARLSSAMRLLGAAARSRKAARDRPPVFFVEGFPGAAFLKALGRQQELLLPAWSDFWRRTVSAYGGFTRIEIWRRAHGTEGQAEQRLFKQALGREVEILPVRDAGAAAAA